MSKKKMSLLLNKYIFCTFWLFLPQSATALLDTKCFHILNPLQKSNKYNFTCSTQSTVYGIIKFHFSKKKKKAKSIKD